MRLKDEVDFTAALGMLCMSDCAQMLVLKHPSLFIIFNDAAILIHVAYALEETLLNTEKWAESIFLLLCC